MTEKKRPKALPKILCKKKGVIDFCDVVVSTGFIMVMTCYLYYFRKSYLKIFQTKNLLQCNSWHRAL